MSSLSLGQSYWEHNNPSSELNTTNFYRPSSTTQETNYLLDNFTKLGKSSPSLDQGYHTLVSPSPGPTGLNLWSDAGILYKGKKYHQTKNNSFDRLPDDVVIKIFSFLSSIDLSICAQVCRRFDALVWTPSLWRIITLNSDNISGDRAIKGVLRQLCGQCRTGACTSVEKIYLSDGAKLSDKSLLLLARRCPELTHLQLQGCTNVTNNALTEIVTKCNNLQHLDLTGNK